MAILVAKLTDTLFEEAMLGGYQLCGGRQGWRSFGFDSGGYVSSGYSSLLMLSLVVLSANLIVALIISVFGFHFSKGPYYLSLTLIGKFLYVVDKEWLLDVLVSIRAIKSWYA